MGVDISGLNEGFSEKQAKQPDLQTDQQKNHLDWHKFFNGDVDLTATISPQDVIDAWSRFKELTFQEWTRFISGANDIDASIIPPEILSSWRQARENKINPLSEPQNEILTGRHLQKLLEDN